MSNIVEYGLKNVHFATQSISGSTVVYGTPVPMPGGVTIQLSPEGDKTTFRADNRIYYEKSKNNGYSGNMELARIPESFKTAVLNEQYDAATGIYYEAADKLPDAFALLFEIDGDATETRFVFYSVTPERPEINPETTGDTDDPKTQNMDVTARPSADRNIVKAWCMGDDASASTVYAAWYTTVQLPTA